MAQPREKGGRVVFIGNIPYGVSEEQICDIFGRIGTVLSFRLVYDKETGKPKGFGFLEYPDVDQAAAAVRNLNGHEIMGRQLKVDYSNDNSGKKDGGGGGGDGHRAPPPAHFDMNNSQAPPMPMGMPNGAVGGAPGELPPLPQGVEIPPGMTAPDAISKTLQAIPAPQLLDILSQMKTLVATDAQKATALLQQAPQLSYAIFQALMLCGLVDTNIVQSLVQGGGQQQQQAPPPQQQQMPYHQPQHQQVPQYQQPPQPQYQQPPPQQQQQYYAQPPPQHQQAPNPYAQQPPPPQQFGYAPTPPTQHAAYPPPPQAYPPQQPPPQQQQTQDQLRAQVMALTREQIFSMPDEARNQLLQLRAQWGAPVQ